MAILAEMERELIIERTHAKLETAKRLGRKGGRTPKMTSSKIESAKKLLASGIFPETPLKISEFQSQHCTVVCQHQSILSAHSGNYSFKYSTKSETVGFCSTAPAGPYRYEYVDNRA